MKTSTKYLYYISLLAIILLIALCNTTQSTLLVDFSNYYSLSSASQSLITMSVSGGMFLALLMMLLGVLRLRKSLLLLTACGLICAMLAALSFKLPFAALICCYCAVGFGFGMIDSSASSVVADLYPDKDGAVKMGLLHAFFGIGGICGPLIIQFLGSKGVDWNLILLVFSGTAAAVLIFGCAVYIPSRGDVDSLLQPNVRLTMPELKELLAPSNALLMIAVGLKGAQEVCISFWIVKYIRLGLGSDTLGPWAISLMWLGSSISRIIVPRLPFKAAKYIIFSMFGTAVVLTAALTFPSAVVMCAATLLVGLISGACIPVGITELCRRHSKNTLAATEGTMICIYTGQALLPTLAGIMFPGLLYAGIIMAAVCGMLSCLLAYMSIRAVRVSSAGGDA